MSHQNWEQVEMIIDSLLELPEDQRQDYIEQTCGDDVHLKNEVTEFLNSIFESKGWLEDPYLYKHEIYQEIADTEHVAEDDQFVGRIIGSYKIRKKIGEGGMGVVYLADRVDEEFDHQVAIKILRQSQALEENILRFQREQRILAGLNHRGIARLFDAGVTKNGNPYIIMEYVMGVPITEYCQKGNSSTQEKISLFKKVLEAIRYAHENLVIHRDLKPGNIFVNESAEVKILDFGISKLLEEDQSPQITQTGSRLLTLKYAAPEQIKQTNITTSTDLYSLGVVFYELLTGTPPFQLDGKTRYESEQIICTEAPPKPSSRTASNQQKNRFSGDLDAITLKAIRKEPEERYRFVNEFLNDILYYEQNLPVSAKTGTVGYQTRKFVKRNSGRIGIAIAILLLSIGFVGFYTWNITQERNIARLEAQKAENVTNLLVDLFRNNDPISGDAETITLETLLENGTDEILNRDMDPSVKIELLLTLTTIYKNISEYEKAQVLALESLNVATQQFGKNSVPVAESYIQLGGLENGLGNYAEAKKHLLQADTLLLNHVPESDHIYADLYHNLAYTEEQLGNYNSSRNLFQQSLQVLSTQPTIDSTLYINNVKSLARGYYSLDDHQTGDSLLLEALDASRSFHGERDVITAGILGDLGMYKMTVAKYDEARDYYTQSLKVKEKVYGEDGHANYTATLTNLAVLEEHVGNYAVAESLFTKALAIDQELLGEDHPYVGMSKNHLAGIYLQYKDFQKALDYREDALNIYLDSYGADHYYMGSMYKNYGHLLSLIGHYDKAESYFEKSLSVYESYEETDKDNFAKLYKVKGEHHLRVGDYENAVIEFQKASELFDEYTYDDYIQSSAESLILMAQAFNKMGQPAEADKILLTVESRIDTSDLLSNNPSIDELITEAENNSQDNR